MASCSSLSSGLAAHTKICPFDLCIFTTGEALAYKYRNLVDEFCSVAPSVSFFKDVVGSLKVKFNIFLHYERQNNLEKHNHILMILDGKEIGNLKKQFYNDIVNLSGDIKNRSIYAFIDSDVDGKCAEFVKEQRNKGVMLLDNVEFNVAFKRVVDDLQKKFGKKCL